METLPSGFEILLVSILMSILSMELMTFKIILVICFVQVRRWTQQWKRREGHRCLHGFRIKKKKKLLSQVQRMLYFFSLILITISFKHFLCDWSFDYLILIIKRIKPKLHGTHSPLSIEALGFFSSLLAIVAICWTSLFLRWIIFFVQYASNWFISIKRNMRHW